MSCGIYMWTSPSGKIYIGQSRNLEKRKKDFICAKKVYTNETSAIDNARRVYPVFSEWKYCVLEICVPTELNEKEKHYIKKYNSFADGYNSSKGGEFDGDAVIEAAKKRARGILQYTLQGTFVKQWDSVDAASKELGITKSVLSNAANHCGKKTCFGHQWMWFYPGDEIMNKIQEIKSRYDRTTEAKLKGVIQYTLEGEIVKVWKSIKDASTSLNISHSHISACCKGKRPVAGNSQWRYSTEGPLSLENIGDAKERIQKARKKTVLQYSLDGDFIKEWDSITAAEKSLGINGISYCVSGKILTSGDFQWKKKISEDYPKRIDKVLPKYTRSGIGKRKTK